MGLGQGEGAAVTDPGILTALATLELVKDPEGCTARILALNEATEAMKAANVERLGQLSEMRALKKTNEALADTIETRGREVVDADEQLGHRIVNAKNDHDRGALDIANQRDAQGLQQASLDVRQKGLDRAEAQFASDQRDLADANDHAQAVTTAATNAVDEMRKVMGRAETALKNA